MADLPAIPDYSQLAQQTSASATAATNAQTTANRPNQVNSTGSLQWTQDPTTGQWTQTQALTQPLQDASTSQQQTQAGLSAGASGLVGQAVNSLQTPTDTSQISGVTNYDPSALKDQIANPGFGAVKEVQDAQNALLQPGLDNSRNSLLARLRAQGVSQDSDAYQRAMNTQDQADNDAHAKSLLSATTAYNDQFNRSLQANQQESNQAQTAFTDSTSDRARQLAEQQTARQQPLSDLKGLLSAAGPVTASPFAGFTSAGNAGGTDYYGAGKDSYGDALATSNAETARTAANYQGNLSLLNTLGGGLLDKYGGDIGTFLKGMFGG